MINLFSLIYAFFIFSEIMFASFPLPTKIVVSPMQVYRQAGTSIVVDVMMGIVKELIKTGVFDE